MSRSARFRSGQPDGTGRKPLHQLLAVRLVAWSVFGAGSHAIFGAVTTVILARGLGARGLGAYGVFLAVAFLLNQVGDLGLGTAYVRLATPLFQSSSSARSLTWTFLYTRLSAVGGLALLAFVARELLEPGRSVGLASYVVPGGAAAVLMAVGSHYSEVLRARLAHRKAATVRAVLAATRAAVYLTLLATGTLTVSRTIGVAVLLVGLESATLAALAHRGAGLWPPGAPQIERSWMVLSAWLFVTSASSALLTHTDTLLLAALSGDLETGLWVGASRLVGPIPLLVGAVWSVVLPISLALTEPAKLQRYLVLARRTAATALILAAAGTLLMVPAVELIFGPEYRQAVAAARWLLIGFGANVAAILYGGLVHRLGLEKALAWVSIVLLVGNGIGDVVLIPSFGAAGCAVVTAVVMFVGAAWAVWRVERSRETLFSGIPQNGATASDSVATSVIVVEP
ncbi:MAG: hypothetical protein AMS18_17100 [Gemmatimonas sp. SG8_17]|nr:MAG: hypothetical protein AMS18_17100 [Gemmatimonas sp. SG8_17]